MRLLRIEVHIRKDIFDNFSASTCKALEEAWGTITSDILYTEIVPFVWAPYPRARNMQDLCLRVVYQRSASVVLESLTDQLDLRAALIRELKVTNLLPPHISVEVSIEPVLGGSRVTDRRN